MTAISRLLVIARGEIAVRVIRSARELGLWTIAAHSEADADSLAVRLADEAICIGPAHAKRSYLNQDAIMAAAAATGADAVHPGYGFLSEAAEFARRVTDAGLTFVGPEAATIARMGDKVAAIEAAAAAGVPVVPGSGGAVDQVDAAAEVAAQVGYPVLLKASAGGGGRGIRLAHDESELRAQFPQAQLEASAAFGDGSLYLERFVARARHIEVQVLGDGSDVVHFFERDCSLQRRRQKVWEEAPAVVLAEEVRERLCASAVALARSVKYRGAGTVEYLYDEATQEFYFIEMNTRIQVEHPITEAICGVDLIRGMLLVAQGAALPYAQGEITRHGHAIEVRVNAEDPRTFMPAPGVATSVSWPLGTGVRVDTALYGGASIPPYYDSLVGKIIVWAQDRDQALARLRGALRETEIEGIATTIPFFEVLLNEPDVRNGHVHTAWIEQWLDRTTPAVSE
ncbi:MAG: acetyl-CoA carboxylase biotin carboxylase subunit [Phycicoccus sp.]|nr:acetyl-CoA carboxylase biotin carboxylase subunit [Phycicoccus sp.]